MLAIRARHAFDGTKIWDGGAVVLVDGQRIRGVEAVGFAVPEGAEVIEVDGTVLPGLINAHVHLCGDSAEGALERLPDMSADHLQQVIETALAQQLASGVTTVRDLGDFQWMVVERRDRPQLGQTHIVASGPPITSMGGHCWMMGGEVAGIDALHVAVRERAERRVDVVKVMASGGNMTPGTDVGACQFTLEELRAVVDESHRLGLPVTAHAHALAAVEQAIEAGADGIEHCTCVTADSMDFSRELMDRIRVRDITVCPTLGRRPGTSPPPRVQEMLARTGMTLERRYELVADAHAAGVRIISGDDGGINGIKTHGICAESIIDLHTGGVSISDALASATSVAAYGCGVGDRKGSLAAGFDADILIVDGDATIDLTALRNVATVFAGGVRTDPA